VQWSLFRIKIQREEERDECSNMGIEREIRPGRNAEGQEKRRKNSTQRKSET
jgi:hypothetical protein